MDLFSTTGLSDNLLPKDGSVYYYGRILGANEANNLFKELLSTIEWKNDQAVIFGNLIVTKRKVAWYADKAFEYTYSNIVKTALPWTPALLRIKAIAEEKTGETYNSCLLYTSPSPRDGLLSRMPSSA